MNRFGVGAMLALVCTSALAQTTTCQEFQGGLVKCSTPQGLSPVPSITNCQTGIGSISCSQPQGMQSVQPPTTYYPPTTTIITVPQPAVPNYLQQQQEELERSRRQTDSVQEQLQLQEYRERQLDLQRRQVQLLEEQRVQHDRIVESQSISEGGGRVTQQTVDCGNDYACDTAIIYNKGGPRSVTGKNWLDAINQPDQSKVHVFAWIMLGNVLYGWEGKSHCSPANRGNANLREALDQAAGIVQVYLKSRPQLWGYPAPDLIGAALGSVWPCQKQGYRPSK